MSQMLIAGNTGVYELLEKISRPKESSVQNT